MFHADRDVLVKIKSLIKTTEELFNGYTIYVRGAMF